MMRGRIRALWYGVAVVTVALAGACAVEPEEARYPIKLNPRLGLASTDDAAIDARLAGPLWPGNPEGRGFALYLFREDSSVYLPLEARVRDKAAAASCVELEALTQAGYEGLYDDELAAQRRLLVECEAIGLLKTARPARASYVHDFVMDAQAVDVLPVMIDNGDMLGRFCEEYDANIQGIPWSDYDKIVEIAIRSDYEIVVTSELRRTWSNVDGDTHYAGGWVWVELLAWGDFDGDRTADLLFMTESYPQSWWKSRPEKATAHSAWNEIYVVTRKAPGVPLRVIDAELYMRKYGHEDCGRS